MQHSSEQQAQVLADLENCDEVRLQHVSICQNLLKPLLPLHPCEAGLKSQDKEEHGRDRGDRLLLIVLGLQDDLKKGGRRLTIKMMMVSSTWKTTPNQWESEDTMLVMPRTLMTVSDPLTSTSFPVVYKERAGRLPGSFK